MPTTKLFESLFGGKKKGLENLVTLWSLLALHVDDGEWIDEVWEYAGQRTGKWALITSSLKTHSAHARTHTRFILLSEQQLVNYLLA